MEFIKNKNIVVLDIETTGIKANTDKIIELYMLKVYNNEVVEEYHSKFNPEINFLSKPLYFFAILITFICSSMLRVKFSPA